jgi:hypothetical protein
MCWRNTRLMLVLAAGAVLWHFVGVAALAQYQYVGPSGGGYPPPYPGFGYGGAVGGYWQGQAAVLDAYGNLGQSEEQARILREQANQAKLVTQKQTSDTDAYLRANKYWYSDEKVDIQTKVIQAAMNNPPAQSINSGQTLNTLLTYLDRLMSRGYRGPTVTIDPEMVKQINVSAGGSENGNVGLLKDINALDWPTGLQGDTQKEIYAALQQAVADLSKGPISSNSSNKIRKATDKLDEENKTKYRKGEIDGVEFIEGNRFMESLRAAEAALKQPTAAKMISGAMGPQGDSVDEVVYSMVSKGLTFAPATRGREYAYQAVYRAFVSFALAADVPDTGFRLRISGGPNAHVLDNQPPPQ